MILISLKHVLINAGVNDIDTKSGMQVFQEMEVTVEQLSMKYPGIKIIFSEITPRNDKRDNEVINVMNYSTIMHHR